MGGVVSSRRAHAAGLSGGATATGAGAGAGAGAGGPLAALEPLTSEPPPPANLDNPGNLDEIHKKCKEVMPVNFEGCKLMINRGINNNFQISQTITMSSMSPSGYKIGATYVGSKQISPTEVFPVILGDVDPDGNLNLNFIHQLTPSWKCRAVGQLQAMRLAAAQISAEHQGSIHTATLTMSSQEWKEGSGVVLAQYLQSVTKPLALGAEIAYQRSPKIPGGEIAVVSAAARYNTDDTEIAAKVGLAGLQLTYYKQASEQLQIGAEVETSFRGQESVGTIGYQIQIPRAELVFRGMVDSNWNVGAVLEKRFTPLPFSFALSGMANQSKQQYRFGVGFIVG
ncbi:mitochondrial import receptor subunit TOM40 homolog 1-like [Arctopsyche grandis]|uniref:mitochondrial import receptor subunit TOM40 homolog 1-like n=1 Tax=Arctopsyche grandis TaxID=121162 RepID=UPI00406D7DAA